MQVIIKEKTTQKVSVLPLTENEPHFETIDEIIHVFKDDGMYDVILEVSDTQNNKGTPFLSINDVKVGRFEATGTDSSQYSFIQYGKNSIPIFYLYIDVVRLKIEFDVSETELFSPHFLIETKDQNMNNINAMLEEMVDADDRILNIIAKQFEPFSESYHLRSSGLKRSHRHTSKEYIEFIHKIIIFFTNKYIDFKNNPSKQIISNLNITRYDRVQKVTSAMIVNSFNRSSLVKVGNGKPTRYCPEYLQCKMPSETYDVYENQAIMSFFSHIIQRMNAIINELTKSNQYGPHFNKNVAPGYSVPALLIRNNIVRYNQKNISEFLDVKKKVLRLQSLYRELFNCSEIAFSISLLRRSKAFSSVSHYYQAYELMYTWLSFTDIDLSLHSILQKIKRVDDLFEYYCLIYLLQALFDLGYEYNEQKSIDHVKKHRALSKEFCQAYSFHDASGQVTLWYQPYVYDNINKIDSEINLCKLTMSKKYPYYHPDFILIHNREGERRINILDSKYSSMNTCKIQYLHDSIIKYGVNMIDVSHVEKKMKNVWLISGRPSIDIHDFEYYNSLAAAQMRQNEELPSYGITPLYPSLSDKQQRMQNFIQKLSR